MKKLLSAALFAVFCAFAGAASAQIKAEHPRNCVMSVGPTQMMFSAFQEETSDEIYCQHLPSGPVLIILDARVPELRDLNLEVRILRDIGQKDWRDNVDANTLAFLRANKYLAANGTTSFRANFDASGEYMAIVRAFSDDGVRDYLGEYRFSVGETSGWYFLAGLLLAVVAIVSFGP
ncbi:MAG: hypothetical protein N2444_07135, partial [Methylocystis sp.]|nr:hypothetical protein [Methylocystis sp.]